jgi:hypothetical protein
MEEQPLRRMHSLALALTVVMTAVTVPLAASAATTTYKFAIPVQLTGMSPGFYQFACAVGTAQPSLLTSGIQAVTSAYNFRLTASSYSGTVSAAPVVSQALEHTYTCVLYQLVSSTYDSGFGPPVQNTVFKLLGAKVTGTM